MEQIEVLNASVTKQVLTLTKSHTFVADTENLYTASFSFDEEWDGFAKTVIFCNDAHDKVCFALLDSSNQCAIPVEIVQEGYLTIGIQGNKAGQIIVTKKADGVRIYESGGRMTVQKEFFSQSEYDKLMDELAKTRTFTQQQVEIATEAATIASTAADEAVATGGQLLSDINTLGNDVKGDLLETNETLTNTNAVATATNDALQESIAEGESVNQQIEENIGMIATKEEVDEIKEIIDSIHPPQVITFEQGAINATSGLDENSSIRIRSNMIRVAPSTTISLTSINHMFNVYKYSIKDGSFIKHIGMRSEDYVLSEHCYVRFVLKNKMDSNVTSSIGKYLVVTNIPRNTEKLDKIDSIEKDINDIKNIVSGKDYNLIIPPSRPNSDCVIKNVPNDIVEHMSLDDIYLAYDALLSDNPTYITKTLLGNDTSDVYPIYRYDFVPELFEFQTLNTESDNCHHYNKNAFPTIIIDSNIHGSEKPATYALLNLMSSIANAKGNNALSWLRENVHFVIIPVVNPHGFIHNTRTNSNRVDLNRNFTQHFLNGSDDITTGQYRGTAPLSEKETQYINAVLKEFDHKAILYCGLHSYGVWSGYDKMTCITISSEKTDDLQHVSIEALKSITRSGWENHELSSDSGIIGVIQLPSKGKFGTAPNQASGYGIPAMSPEVMYRYYDGGQGAIFNTNVNCMNVEFLLRIIIGAVNKFLY